MNGFFFPFNYFGRKTVGGCACEWPRGVSFGYRLCVFHLRVHYLSITGARKEKQTKKKDSLSSGQHTAVTENEIWNDNACVWNEPMIAVSRIIKKGSRSKPWRAFLPTSSVYSWERRKTSVCSRRNKCNKYLRLPPVWIVGSVQEVLKQKWNGPTPSSKVASYGQF